MFIQIIRGKVTDADEFRRAGERWATEVRPGAIGYRDGVAGVTDDGRFIIAARFESEEAARKNGDRPEQGASWAEIERTVEAVTFAESTEVVTLLGGANSDAGFVQVMAGRVTDAAALESIKSRLGEFESVMSQLRPDVLGEVIAIHPDGTYTDVVYFTSEAAARAGETATQEPPPEAKALLDELMSAIEIDEYLDLRDPWLQ